jgi:outer membrane protein assembly factor BamB
MRATLLLAAALALAACSGPHARRPGAAPDRDVAFGPAWSVPLDAGVEIHLAAAPGGFLVAAPDGRLELLSAAGGASLWRRRLGAGLAGAPVAADGAVAAARVDGSLAALRAETGEILSTWRPEEGPGAVSSGGLQAPPRITAGGGRVLHVSAEGVARAYRPGLPDPLWKTRLLPPAPAGGALCAGQFLVGLADGRIVGLDAESGRVLWRKRLGAPLAAPPGCEGRRVLAATADNRLHALRLHRRSAGLVWRARTGADPAAPPLAAGKLALLLSKDTHLYGFREGNGHLAFRVRLDRRPGPAALLDDVILVAGFQATRLDAFRLPAGRSAGGFALPEGSRFITPPVISGGTLAIALARYGEASGRLIALAAGPDATAPAATNP